MVSKTNFWALNIGYLTKAIQPACQNICYIVKVYLKNDHSSEGKSLDEVVRQNDRWISTW